jgi:hypothetical protein
MTFMGGLSIVTRQYAGDRRVTRISADFVGAFICVSLAGAFIVAMGFLDNHSARTKRGAQLDDGIADTFVSTAVR